MCRTLVRRSIRAVDRVGAAVYSYLFGTRRAVVTLDTDGVTVCPGGSTEFRHHEMVEHWHHQSENARGVLSFVRTVANHGDGDQDPGVVCAVCDRLIAVPVGVTLERPEACDASWVHIAEVERNDARYAFADHGDATDFQLAVEVNGGRCDLAEEAVLDARDLPGLIAGEWD